MSRGLGRVERAVLDYLKTRPDWACRLELVADVTGFHAESVRRAFKSLERKDMVILGWDNGWRVIDGAADRFYDTACPTARLSAEYSSTLTAPGHTNKETPR